MLTNVRRVWFTGSPRKVRLTVSGLSKKLARSMTCKRYLVDATHSNLWNDESRCELESVQATDEVERVSMWGLGVG